jgi:N-acetyl sugar amidotransferase
MDTIDDQIVFDNEGICNHCKQQKVLMNELKSNPAYSETSLKALVKQIKSESSNREYDVVVGLSGGVDSAYALHIATQLGLKPLVVHVDAGWNSEIAVNNIYKLCNKLNVDLETIIVDWSSMKMIQRAFMLSRTFNQDIPQDHIFLAGVYSLTAKYKIKYMITGLNFQTEGISPNSNLGYDPIDLKFIKSILNSHSSKEYLKKIPHMSLLKYLYYISRVKKINVLNFSDYKRKDAIALLKSEYDWSDYGSKHHESILTRFIQTSYLLERYDYDKRKIHFSSLILNGELTRSEAIKLLNEPPLDKNTLLQDKRYILTKLNIKESDYEDLIKSSYVDHNDYDNNEKLISMLMKLKRRLNKVFS